MPEPDQRDNGNWPWEVTYGDSDLPELESVRILRLQPGDTIVIRLADNHEKAVMEAVRDDVERRFPGHEVLVLGPKLDLEILRDGDDA